jgi:predicted peptidase
MLKISFLWAFIVIARFSSAQEFAEFEKHSLQTTHDTLLYRLLKPKDLKENQQYPLVLFLHGSSERGNDNVKNLKYITDLFLNEKNRNQFPCYVIAPQCPTAERWTYPDWYQEPREPMRTVIALIDSLSSLPNIDKNRIYVAGASIGEYGTWYLLTRFPDKFAAAIPICGGGDPHRVNSFAHVPIWAFHGAKDPSINPEESRKMIKAIEKAGGKPTYTEYKKVAHDSWIKAFQEPTLLAWLFSQRLPK